VTPWMLPAVEVVEFVLPEAGFGRPAVTAGGAEVAFAEISFTAAPYWSPTLYIDSGLLSASWSFGDHPALVGDSAYGFEFVKDSRSFEIANNVHIVDMLYGAQACLPFIPIPANMTTDFAVVDTGLVFTPIAQQHEVVVHFDDGGMCNFSPGVAEKSMVLGGLEHIQTRLQTYNSASMIQTHCVVIHTPELTCVPNGCPMWGYIIIGCVAINIIPSPLWYEIDIEYDYSNTDPKDMAFIF